jgi:predicted AAA+ superfamily ATPase
MDGIQNAVLMGDIKINEGALAENTVASELVKHGIPLYYFDKKTRMEIDFVFKDDNRLSIIDVKSGNEYKKHAALDNAYADYPMNFNRRIVLCKGNVEVSDDGVIYLPLYFSMFITSSVLTLTT